MEAKKILKVDIADCRNLQVLGLAMPDEVKTDSVIHFKVYEPSILSLETPEGIKDFLERILQENHKWDYQSDKNLLIVDDVKYDIKNKGLGNYFKSQLTRKGFSVYSSDQLRSNFKVYQEFLPFLKGTKKTMTLKDKIIETLTSNNIIKKHFYIEEVYFRESGYKIKCVTYRHDERSEEDIYPNFELFYDTKNKIVKLIGFLHNEGETYYNGEELEPLTELESELQYYQRRIELFHELNEKIKNIKFEL